MKKRYLALLLLSLLALALPLLAGAETQSGACGDNLTWTLDDSGLLTISGTGEMYGYTSVGINVNYNRIYRTNAPWGQSTVKQVMIQKGVTKIGSYAFFNCGDLTNVTIPGSVKDIGKYAFSGCKSLTSAVIPKGVTSIAEEVFAECTSLTSVTIPDSVTGIYRHAFSNCASLTGVTIPDSVTYIDELAFMACGLTSVTIPDSVAYLGQGAFSMCRKLTSVKLPGSMTAIPDDIFSYCSSLPGVTIPAGVTSIGEHAFECSSLKSITLPSNLKSIGEYAFAGCDSLTSVTIPNSVTSIGDYLFSGCDSLTGVTLPNSVKSLNNGFFYKCTGLTDITIPESVTAIGKEAFRHCSSLKSAVIPQSVASIGEKAFAECGSGLTASCYSGSVAHQYAQKNGIRVFLLDGAKPAVIAQPRNAAVYDGEKVTFKVTAEGAESYQWYYRASSGDAWKKPSSGGTSAVFSFTAKAAHDGRQFRCVMKNTKGSAASKTVTLTIKTKPVITTEPKSVTVNEGKTAKLQVKATGAQSYQWYYRASSGGAWKKISGATAAAYSFTAKAAHNGREFRCLVKNPAGSVYTSAVKLTVHPLPVITAQPKSAAVNEGQKATFKAAATGASSYQWYYRKSASGTWTKCGGSTAATAAFSLTVKAAHNGYQYRCLVKNGAGSVFTNTATLTVHLKPIVTVQPEDAASSAGTKVTFTVTAEGADTYQWYYRKSATGKWQKCSGSAAAKAAFTLAVGTNHNGYQYRCLVKNSVGGVYSAAATLTVSQP